MSVLKENFETGFEEMELNKEEEVRQSEVRIDKLREEVAELNNTISAERKQTDFMK